MTALRSLNPRRRLLAGFGWNIAGQGIVVGVSLGLTPLLLNRLGATIYGIFALAATLRGFLSNVDGGLAPTGYRYFPIYVGADDPAATTSLLVTLVGLVIVVVGSLALAMFLLAPLAVRAFALGTGIAGHGTQVTFAVRALLPALLLAGIRTPMQRMLMAHHRWGYVNLTQVLAVLAYAATAISLTAAPHPGLSSLIWATYAQEGVLLLTALWGIRTQIHRAGMRILPFDEVRELLRFGGRVQIAALASSFNYELNSLIVGLLFPLSDVAYYSIGANFSQQVITLPVAGLNPIAQDLGREYARTGRAGLRRSFRAAQRSWVRLLGIYPIVAGLIGWFGIQVWIGHGGRTAGAVGAVLVIGTAPLLYNSIVDVAAKTAKMPEIESWYLGVGVALNLFCAIPLALTVGVIGVAVGTALGQMISFIVCITLARRRLGPEVVSFLRDLNVVPWLVSIGVGVSWEAVLHNRLPSGALGLIGSGILTVPAFACYYTWTFHEGLLTAIRARGRPRALASSNLEVREREALAQPMQVHQIIFSTLEAAEMPPASELLRDAVGSAHYRLWRLDDARELLGDVYGSEVITAFDTLRPFAYKADLARYCIVAHLGGTYIDLSVTAFAGLNVGARDFVGFRDLNNMTSGWKMANNLFYARAGSPVLERSIDLCVRHVGNRFYGKDPHWPTGPAVLGQAVAERSGDLDVLIGDYIWLQRRRNKYLLPGAGVVARGKPGGKFLGGVSGVPGGNNYNEMWAARTVYA